MVKKGEFQYVFEADEFMKMPLSVQALYFHLDLQSADDGFVENPDDVVRAIGASQSDLDMLFGKRFMIALEDGALVIKHSRIYDLLSENENKVPSFIKEIPNDKSVFSVKMDYDVIKDMWNELDGFGNIKPIRSISPGSKRRSNVRARLKQYNVDDFRIAIENIKRSDFLQGKNKNGWAASFDWFVLPSNFPKVLEGNYNRDSGGNDSEWSQYLNE